MVLTDSYKYKVLVFIVTQLLKFLESVNSVIDPKERFIRSPPFPFHFLLHLFRQHLLISYVLRRHKKNDENIYKL